MLKTFDKNTPSEDVIRVLLEEGALIVANQADVVLVNKVSAELRPHFDEQGAKFQNDFNGYSTLRVAGVLGYSRTAAELMAHKRVMEVADAALILPKGYKGTLTVPEGGVRKIWVSYMGGPKG